MYVVLTNRLLDRPGGEQKQLLLLARMLEDYGHRVTVITAYLDRDRCYPKLLDGLDVRAGSGPRVDRFPTGSFFSRVRGRIHAERSQWDEAARFSQLLPKDADLVNWHGAAPQASWIACRRSGGPRRWVWMCNDLPAPFYELAADLRTRGRLRHPTEVLKKVAKLPRFADAAARSQLPPGTVTVLDQTNRWWWKHGLGREAVVVPWGLEFDTYYRPIRKRTPGAPLNVLAAGIMSPFRRFEDTIDGVAMARQEGADVRLTLLGQPSDAQYVSRLKRRISQHAIGDFVTFHGFLSNEDYERVRSETHVLVLTTHGQTWGQVTTESAAAGIPSIINDTATTLEFFRDGESTLVSRFGDPSSISRGLVRLARDEALRLRLAENAQNLARLFSWERYGRAMDEVFTRTMTDSYTRAPIRL